MKHYIGQLLLGTLVLGSACTNHREIIEGDTSVNVTFKAQQSPSTKGGDDDEMSVLIFKKEENQFTKTESIQESPWFTEKEHLQKNILLRLCQNADTASFYAQSPDFLKPGLCYYPKFSYL